MLSEFLKRLMFGRQFSMDEGKIRIIGSRHVMYPLHVLIEIHHMDPDGLYLAVKKGIIDELNKSPGVIGIKNLHPTYSIVSFYETMGIGTMNILSFDPEKKEAVVRIHEHEFKQIYSSGNKLCDSFIAGVIAGIFSYVMSDSVDCKETVCIDSGSEFCQFEISKNSV
jgi:predicted hydrocarbon binding protein